MTKGCIVPQCRTGFKNVKEKCSVFKVPSNIERLKKWLAAIPGLTQLKPTQFVCEKHFEERFILRKWIKRDLNGRIIAEAPYKIPRLDLSAVPSIFNSDNIPQYCSRRRIVNDHRFPKDEESRKKWLTFCGIDERVLNTATKLCSNHFQKDDIIHKTKGTIVKPKTVPSIISKKRKLHQRSDLIKHEDFSLKKLKDASCHNRTIDNINFDNVDIDNTNFDDRTADKGNFEFVSVKEEPTNSLEDNEFVSVKEEPTISLEDNEFVSVKEEPTISLEETCATVNCPSTSPSCETIQCSRRPVRATHTLRYIGDIRTPDLDTPKKAERALELAKRVIAKQRRKIKTLQQARNRLTSRVTLLEGLLKHLKQKVVPSEITAENFNGNSKYTIVDNND